MTLTTRATIRREVLRQVGGHVATLTAAGTATTIISDAMRYRFSGDDAAGRGMVIYDPADITADQLRSVTEWDDSAGAATVDGMGGSKAGTEIVEYYLRNDPGPIEVNEAINRMMRNTYRVAEVVIPTFDGAREYELRNAPWIARRRDIYRIEKRESPNIVTNSGFQAWGRGTDAALQGWGLTGSGATVTRVAGPYSFAARIARVGADALLRQEIPIPITQLYGKSITVFARIKSGTASIASVRINDGTDTTSTLEHDGGGDWDEFTATHTVNADAAGPLTIDCRVIDANGSADFEAVVAVVGTTIPDWLSLYGDQHERTQTVKATAQMRAPVPIIVLEQILAQGSQIVVQSRQPFVELTEDSNAGGITDLALEAAVAGTIVKLAEVHSAGKPNAARWERLGAYWLPKYAAWQRQLAEPSPEPTARRVVIGPA